MKTCLQDTEVFWHIFACHKKGRKMEKRFRYFSDFTQKLKNVEMNFQRNAKMGQSSFSMRELAENFEDGSKGKYSRACFKGHPYRTGTFN